MTKQEQQEFDLILDELSRDTPVAEIARMVGVSLPGFPHRVVALLRKNCQADVAD